MNLKRIKEILKSKKGAVITSLTIGVVVITIAGGTLIYSEFYGNNKEVVTTNQKADNIKNEKKKEKNKLEELKKIDKSKLSEEEKKDLENKISNIENKTTDEEANLNSTSNKDNETQNNSENANKVETNSNKNGEAQNNSINDNKIQEAKPEKNTDTSIKNEHTHNWEAVTSVVHHEEVGHWEDVLVEAARTETVPKYKDDERAICNQCGADTTDCIEDHEYNHISNGEPGGWHTESRRIQIGSETLNYGAVYDKKWVVDKKAYDETVTTGYKCSCGSNK